MLVEGDAFGFEDGSAETGLAAAQQQTAGLDAILVRLDDAGRLVAEDEQSLLLGIVVQAGDIAKAAAGEAHQDGGWGGVAFRLGRDDFKDGRGAFFAGDKEVFGQGVVRDPLETVGDVYLDVGSEFLCFFPADAAVLGLKLDDDDVAACLLGHGEPGFAQPRDALGGVELVEVDFSLEGTVEVQFDNPLWRGEHDE